MELRPYQRQLIEGITAELRSGAKRVVGQLAVGGGKTLIMGHFARYAASRGAPVLILSDRRKLVQQMAGTLEEMDVRHGVIMARVEDYPDARVQVASLQTLMADVRRVGPGALPRAALIIVDEAHRVVTRQARAFFERYPKAAVLGFTATPTRPSGGGLGDFYERLVCGPTIAELQSQGYLAPLEYFVPAREDLEALRRLRTDEEWESHLDKPNLVGSVTDNWARLAGLRKTLVFASGVRHSIHLRDSFRAMGVKAEHIDGSLPDAQRQDVYERFDRGEFQVLTNAMLVTEGYNQPDIDCVVVARPAKSVVLWTQMLGRGTRTYTDPLNGWVKRDCLVIDHAGAIYEHGRVEHIGGWTLDPDTRIDAINAERRKEDTPNEERDIVCSRCGYLYRKAPMCPRCQNVPERSGRYADYVDARLIGLDKGKQAEYGDEDKRRWYAEALGWCREHGKRGGYAAYLYRAKFKEAPRWEVKPLPPSSEVAGFVQHMRIRRARRKHKEAA